MNNLFNQRIDSFEIHCFDWDGNAITKFIINEGISALSPFTVDEESQTIYTVNTNYADQYVRTFKY